MLDHLAQLGELVHVPNPAPHKGGAQWAALKSADAHPLVAGADWILPLDIDEFVNIHVGDHDLASLLAALPDATAITLTWRLFGNNGVMQFEDAPVTRQFTQAAPAIMHWPWRATMFKTLVRNDGTYRRLGVHRPQGPVPEKLPGARWFDGSGRRLPDRFLKGRVFSDPGLDHFKLAQLNHYPLGAMESYVLKADRGRAVHTDHVLGLDYWVERNFNTHQDRSILATESGRQAQLSRLLSVPEIAQYHRHAVSWRRHRFDILMKQENFRELFTRLTMAAPSVPISEKLSKHLIHIAKSAKQ